MLLEVIPKNRARLYSVTKLKHVNPIKMSPINV